MNRRAREGERGRKRKEWREGEANSQSEEKCSVLNGGFGLKQLGWELMWY